jgi:hypothetical protein
LPAVLSAAVVRKYEWPSVILRSALLQVSNSTASRIASFKQKFGHGQDNRQNGYRVNPQKEHLQTDNKSENVGRGRGRARPLRSEVTTNQNSIQVMPALPYLLYHQVSSENYHDLKSLICRH